jgi:hypothetical protein
MCECARARAQQTSSLLVGFALVCAAAGLNSIELRLVFVFAGGDRSCEALLESSVRLGLSSRRDTGTLCAPVVVGACVSSHTVNQQTRTRKQESMISMPM